MGALASDQPKWRSMASFLKRPFLGVDHMDLYSVLAWKGIENTHVSAGASADSFVGEDNLEDQDMQVGDDCEEYAEVQLLVLPYPNFLCLDAPELKCCCSRKYAHRTTEP